MHADQLTLFRPTEQLSFFPVWRGQNSATLSVHARPSWKELLKASREYGEHRDCAVKAVAAAAGISYQEAHAALEKHGRKRRHGTYVNVTLKALESLGFKTSGNLRNQFAGRTVRSLQNELRRGVYLLRTASHIAAAVDGEVIDYTAGRLHRVREIIRVTKEEN